jgi:hypothetical protein
MKNRNFIDFFNLAIQEDPNSEFIKNEYIQKVKQSLIDNKIKHPCEATCNAILELEANIWNDSCALICSNCGNIQEYRINILMRNVKV